jgi:hypothetical protein
MVLQGSITLAGVNVVDCFRKITNRRNIGS